MIKHVVLGPASGVPLGEGRTFQIGPLRVAVFLSRQGRPFATQADCPHRKGPLADGLVGGTTLVCPLHEWSFDLTSGMALNGSCGIQTYPVRVDPSGSLVIELEEEGTAPPPWRVNDYARFGPTE
jgi:nitrite reductase (NADH) small subunit